MYSSCSRVHIQFKSLLPKLLLILHKLSSICYSSLTFWLLYAAILTTATISWVLLTVQNNFHSDIWWLLSLACIAVLKDVQGSLHFTTKYHFLATFSKSYWQDHMPSLSTQYTLISRASNKHHVTILLRLWVSNLALDIPNYWVMSRNLYFYTTMAQLRTNKNVLTYLGCTMGSQGNTTSEGWIEIWL
jgi:hypothetical protein